MPFKNCEYCGKEFRYYYSDPRKFCSVKCSVSNSKILYSCLNCGEEFLINKCFVNEKTVQKKVCSDKCYNDYNAKIEENKKKNKLYKCDHCGIYFTSYYGRQGKKYIFCGQRCSKEHMRGKNSPFYETGKSINVHGYVVLKYGKTLVYEHREIMEKKLGRKLLKTEIVHHKDGNKSNNSLDNLEIMDKRLHDSLHSIRRHNERKIRA